MINIQVFQFQHFVCFSPVVKHQKQRAIKFDALLTFFLRNINFPVKSGSIAFPCPFQMDLTPQIRWKKSFVFLIKNNFWCFLRKNLRFCKFWQKRKTWCHTPPLPSFLSIEWLRISKLPNFWTGLKLEVNGF